MLKIESNTRVIGVKSSEKFGICLLFIIVSMFSACGQTQLDEGAVDDVVDNEKINISTNLDQQYTEKDVQEIIKNISVENATYNGVCGQNATWYWQDNILVIKGNGEVTEAMWKSSDKSGHDLSDLTSLVIIEDGITNIPEDAFRKFHSLSKIYIPNTVSTIGDSAFYGCRSLTSITIPDSIISIGNNVFGDCVLLKSIITEAELINGNWFTSCDGLTQIEARHSNNIVVDGVVFNKDKTKLIVYPQGKTETSYIIPDSITNIGESAFYSCESLTSIIIPDSVTTIGDSAFSECRSLTSITLPDGITSIGNNVFSMCKSLTSITIPNSVTAIGDYAFNSCSSLESITIPDSVTHIGYCAFVGIDHIYYNGNAKDDWNWGSGSIN